MSGRGGETQPIFRQMKAEWSNQELQLSSNITNKPFIFHVQNNTSTLFITVTDFHTNTFQAINQDMRDCVKEAFTSEDLKLVLEGQSESGGAVSARVIAQKSDGMPTISISLDKLVDAAAREAMANISVELLKLYKNEQELLIDEQSQCCKLAIVLAAVQEKRDVMQGQLDASVSSVPRQDKNNIIQSNQDASSDSLAIASSTFRQEKNVATKKKLETSSASRPQKFWEIVDLETSNAISQNTSDTQTAKTTSSSKVTNLVVPACHRETFEGIILIDSDDERD